MSVDLAARLAELARITRAPSPVVSVYLGTRWVDEHQRERVRVFLANEIKRARQVAGPALGEDLDWVAAQGEAIVQQTLLPDAHGVVLFACGPLGLREALPVRAAVEDTFVVDDAPYLRRLAEIVRGTPSALVVFVDGERARLIQVGSDGVGAEVTLASAVPSRHRQGGWRLLAQARFQRHTETHRGRHFDAVAATLADVVDEHGVDHVVLAGEARTLAVFRRHLEGRVAQRVAGTIAAARHEPASALAARAAPLLRLREGDAEVVDVAAVLTEAAKGGRATAGLEATLEAAGRGAVHRLYVLASFREIGRQCGACGALQPGEAPVCRLCRGATKEVELGEALVQRVLATGGAVQTVAVAAGLERAGGVAAQLRYPL